MRQPHCSSRLLFAALWAAPLLIGQNKPPDNMQELQARYSAHKNDFDYLLGDWEFTGESKRQGKFTGRWSAAKMDNGQIVDEYRVYGDKGQTVHVTSTIRSYNAFADRWELIGFGGGNGLQDFGTAQRTGSEVHIEQRFGVAGGHPSTFRITYSNITPDSFSWSADVSSDGQNFTKQVETLEVHRIGPARKMGPMTEPKKP